MEAMRRTLIVSALVVAATVLAAPAADARPQKCLGKRATVVGTPGDDRLYGRSGADVIAGLGGDDVLLGRTGEDLICAGSGDDFVRAGAGSDAVSGSVGNDVLAGDPGNDDVRGGPGEDTVYGGDGSDDLSAGPGNSSILLGNAGPDRLLGGDGRDVLVGQEGNDVLRGGQGLFDVASFLFADNPEGVTANIAAGSASGEGEDTLAGIEGLEGSAEADRLTGDGQVNYFYPREGDDTIVGGGAEDLVSFFFAENRVTASLITGNATGEGADVMFGIRSLEGSPQADTLEGNLFENGLFGRDGGDSLLGNESDDVLDGGNGTDRGNGGLHGLEGDRCISVEVRTDCEIVESDLERGSAASGPLLRLESLAPALP